MRPGTRCDMSEASLVCVTGNGNPGWRWRVLIALDIAVFFLVFAPISPTHGGRVPVCPHHRRQFQFCRLKKIHCNWEGGTEISDTPPPPHVQSAPRYNITHQRGTFLPRVSLHRHIVITQRPWFMSRASLLGCTFCGFGQMRNELCPSPKYTEYFHRLKNSLHSACSCIHALPMATNDLFYCLHWFVLSRSSYSWNRAVCSVCRLVSFS